MLPGWVVTGGFIDDTTIYVDARIANLVVADVKVIYADARIKLNLNNFLVRGNGHRVLISDLQLLRWYSRRRDIRRSPLPYATVKDAIMDLLAYRETPVHLDSNTQLLITDDTGAQGKPCTINIRHGQRRHTTPTDTDIMRSYAIDTLFASEYYTGNTEEIDTTDALKAPDSAQFTIAIQKEIHSLVHETKTFIPITKTLTGYRENSTSQRLHMATMDIKSAYLNAPLPLNADNPDALYGRIFYLHYKKALLTEGYTMSVFDNCLFYRDYSHTLDRDATSFLGLNLSHNPDGTITITQPKLLTKLFAPYIPAQGL
eukprot:gene35459-biopygen28015